MVNTSLVKSLLSLQTLFTCSMMIPGTHFSLKEETIYLSSDIRNTDQSYTQISCDNNQIC